MLDAAAKRMIQTRAHCLHFFDARRVLRLAVFLAHAPHHQDAEIWVHTCVSCFHLVMQRTAKVAALMTKRNSSA
jgi:hypothetical protein